MGEVYEAKHLLLGRRFAVKLLLPRYADQGEMLARFRQRDFAGAANTIVRCRDAGDGFGLEYLLDLYTSRIRAFEQAPPPADWNGVFVLESK